MTFETPCDGRDAFMFSEVLVVRLHMIRYLRKNEESLYPFKPQKVAFRLLFLQWPF